MDDERRKCPDIDPNGPIAGLPRGGRRQHGRTGASDTPVHELADILPGGGMADKRKCDRRRKAVEEIIRLGEGLE